jgi:hypothetical protein
MPKQIDPAGLVINTLFGPALAEKVCNTCNKEKLIIEFHIESASTRKHSEQRRNQCKDCWYRFNGDANWGKYVLSLPIYCFSDEVM